MLGRLPPRLVTAYVKLSLVFLNADGWVNYDDVELVKQTTGSPNLVPNPGFENHRRLDRGEVQLYPQYHLLRARAGAWQITTPAHTAMG